METLKVSEKNAIRCQPDGMREFSNLRGRDSTLKNIYLNENLRLSRIILIFVIRKYPYSTFIALLLKSCISKRKLIFVNSLIALANICKVQ